MNKRILAILLCIVFSAFLCVSALATEAEIADTYTIGALDDESIGIIGGADGPTAIFVTSTGAKPLIFVILLAVAVISAIGIYKNRKK